MIKQYKHTFALNLYMLQRQSMKKAKRQCLFFGLWHNSPSEGHQYLYHNVTLVNCVFLNQSKPKKCNILSLHHIIQSMIHCKCYNDHWVFVVSKNSLSIVWFALGLYYVLSKKYSNKLSMKALVKYNLVKKIVN